MRLRWWRATAEPEHEPIRLREAPISEAVQATRRAQAALDAAHARDPEVNALGEFHRWRRGINSFGPMYAAEFERHRREP